MQPLLFGPVDSVLMPVIEFLILGLVILNLGTRFLAHQSHLRGAETDGSDGITLHRPHFVVNLLLAVASFYYMTIDLRAGIGLTVLVVGLVITDLFELESRRVEARTDRPLETPKAALTLSAIVLFYALVVALFFLVEPIFRMIV